jgi:hypothetical protein
MFIIGLATLLCWAGFLYADYTIVLKNGGRITVKDYREEKGMVMLEGLGGEIGIAKQQIQSILQAGESESQGLNLGSIEKSQPTADAKVLTAEYNSAQRALEEAGPNIRRFEVRDEEEKEDQEKLDVNTEAIESRTELYRLISRGKPGVEPTLLDNLVALEGRINLLNSWIKDARSNPARARGTGVVRLITNSTFAGRRRTIELRHEGVVRPGRVNVRPFRTARAGVLLPGYTSGERELSDLKKRLLQLCKERKRLIQSIKQEGRFTGSLPYIACPN